MGMDVCGLNPSAESGQYFRANIWGWRPIHSLMVELCSDLLDEQTLWGMNFNSGSGPTDGEVCKKMAERFNNWLEHNVDGKCLESDIRVTEEGRLVMTEEQIANPELPTRSAYDISDERLKLWVEFLRHCGGFEVW